MNQPINRRTFLKSSTAAGGLTLLPAGLIRGTAANEKVRLGIIGAGGRGEANLKGLSGEAIVALCDVDRNHLAAAAGRFPQARTYTDYRKLLEKEKLDAVVVSTPDHQHAPAALTGMQQGLHCYCEKPLTRDVNEAWLMTRMAAERKLVTHMGTGFCGSERTIREVEVIRSGAIGEVAEAHFWTNRPIWPQGFDRPTGRDDVPPSLDWESWIGSAPMRPYVAHWPDGHPIYDHRWGKNRPQVYHPFVWRGWWDFGTGALGDFAPHYWHSAYWGLELGAPSAVEVLHTSEPVTEMFPRQSILRFDFPAREKRRAMKLFWYDGGKRPSPEVFGAKEVPDHGWVILGSKATLGRRHKSADDFPSAPKTLRRPGNMYSEWIAGIKTGDPGRPSCPFSYAGPLTEAYLLGNIALRVNQRIEWDAEARRITNCREANPLLQREYRKGWEV